MCLCCCYYHVTLAGKLGESCCVPFIVPSNSVVMRSRIRTRHHISVFDSWLTSLSFYSFSDSWKFTDTTEGSIFFVGKCFERLLHHVHLPVPFTSIVPNASWAERCCAWCQKKRAVRQERGKSGTIVNKLDCRLILINPSVLYSILKLFYVS